MLQLLHQVRQVNFFEQNALLEFSSQMEKQVLGVDNGENARDFESFGFVGERDEHRVAFDQQVLCAVPRLRNQTLLDVRLIVVQFELFHLFPFDDQSSARFLTLPIRKPHQKFTHSHLTANVSWNSQDLNAYIDKELCSTLNYKHANLWGKV